MATYRRLYLPNHPYFLTVVTDQRRPLLIEHIDLLRKAFQDAKRHYSFHIDSIVILPDHFHVIIEPEPHDIYPKIIRAIKYNFTRSIDSWDGNPTLQNRSGCKKRKGEQAIWQRRFYEHTIRNEKELALYRDYIHYNPVKHRIVSHAGDWEYSTFRRYVSDGYYPEDWCNFSDDIDLE